MGMGRGERFGRYIVVCAIFAMIAGMTPGPALAARQVRPGVPPDLASMVLTPADLSAAGLEGFRRGSGEDIQPGLIANRMQSSTGLLRDDILAFLEDTGWQRDYALPLELHEDLENPESLLRTVRSSVTVYETSEGAEEAFAFLEDESAFVEPALYQDIEIAAIGEESELTVEYVENQQGELVPIQLQLTFRTGPFIGEILMMDGDGTLYANPDLQGLDPTPDGPDAIAVANAAGIMVEKVLDVGSVEDPAPGVLALRFDVDAGAAADGEDVSVLELSSGYLLYDGEPIPFLGSPDLEIDQMREEAREEARLHSYASFSVIELQGTGDLAWIQAIVERYADEDAAQIALDTIPGSYANRDNLQQLPGIGDYGDGAVGLSFSVTGSNGDVRTAYRLFARFGSDIVAIHFLPVASELPAEPATMLMEAQVTCYEAGSCLEEVQFPLDAFMETGSATRIGATTEESPTSTDAPEDDDANAEEDSESDDHADGDAHDSAEFATFESPNYGYTLTYSPDTWSVAGEDNDEDDPYDYVYLTNGLSIVGVFGDPDYDDGDLEGCIDDYTTLFEEEDGVTDIDDMRGRRNGGSDDDRAWETYTYVYEGEEDRVRYYECRALDDGITLVILHDAADGDYDDEAEAREELLEGVDF